MTGVSEMVPILPGFHVTIVVVYLLWADRVQLGHNLVDGLS